MFLLHCVIIMFTYLWISLSLPNSENRVWACIWIVLWFKKKNRVLISAFVNYFIQQHMLHSALLPQNTTKHWSFTEWSYCLNSEEEGYSVTRVCCIAGVLSLTLRNGLANLGWGGSRGRRCVASMPDKSWTFHISITNTPEAFFF